MKMNHAAKLRALKGTKLSSAEFAQVKNLKEFNSADWKWDGDQGLYLRIN